MPKVGRGRAVHNAIVRNRSFEEFAARGYHVTAWQFSSLRICPETPGSADCSEYEEKLRWLHKVRGGWTERFRWLVGRYQQSDPWLERVKGFFPFRFGTRITGPLAPEGLWPDGLSSRIRQESHKTLFVAHLLTPHSPYLYHRDGSIRPLKEWIRDRSDRRVSRQEYRELYCRYCEQVEYVAGQLESLLEQLSQGGLLDSMTVVVHGDHGSRILRILGNSVNTEDPGKYDLESPGVFDYVDEPDGRDLVDHFSALLAVKPAGASTPSICDERHSLLTFLSRTLFQREPADGVERADKVYLVDSGHRMRAVDIQRYWK